MISKDGGAISANDVCLVFPWANDKLVKNMTVQSVSNIEAPCSPDNSGQGMRSLLQFRRLMGKRGG